MCASAFGCVDASADMCSCCRVAEPNLLRAPLTRFCLFFAVSDAALAARGGEPKRVAARFAAFRDSAAPVLRYFAEAGRLVDVETSGPVAEVRSAARSVVATSRPTMRGS